MPALRFDQAPANLCILRLSAIGDVTHILPVIATLQQQWPDTRITWIIGAVEYELVRSLSGVEFIVFNKKNGFSEYLALRKKMADRRFEVLLMMQVALRASLLSLLIKARYRIGYDKKRARDFQSLFSNSTIEGPDRVHVLDTFFQFIEKLGIRERCMNWLIKPAASDREFAQGIVNNKPAVVINPCSSVRKNNWRNWPEERYAAVVDHLVKSGHQVILSGGRTSQEQAFSKTIEQLSKHEVINLVGKTTLMQLLALLQKSRFMIAPDTGPAHIGTAAGIPVIGLYASSNPLRTGPYNSQSHLINAYPEALQTYLSITPEQARWGQRVRHPGVMHLISVEEVIHKILSLD